MAALEKIKHIVVLMLENRSFDNMLGWLYDPQNPPPFNQPPSSGTFHGVSLGNLSNPSVAGPLVRVGKGTDPTAPDPDPGEPYEDVYAQVYGQKDVPILSKVPAAPTSSSNMQGFLYNYTLKCAGGQTNPSVIMNCFTSATVPVLWSLAYNYGVCDHWFASIPTQTLCNRSYLHAGTSSGYVDNEGGDGILFVNDTPTIFNVMTTAGRNWKIYCASWVITSLALLTQSRLWDECASDRFAPLADFCTAAATPGGLPEYSFIEPIYLDSLVWGPENDMHPESQPLNFDGPSNVEQGEKLLYTVYNAVRNSPDWDSTLLLILFDEHGGCYDHVCPATFPECKFAISPDGVVIPQTQPGGSGFNFDRLGVRVPAIVVSPYTDARTVVNTVYDHTSALSTIVNCLGLPASQLGKRQIAAPDLSEALNRTTARADLPPIPQPAGWDPSFSARLAVSSRALLHARAKPLNDLQKKILIGAARRLSLSSARIDEASQLATHLDADAYLMKAEAELLAKKL
ncbi:MAG TPA: alkaline phosphatase family protein [Candidatus Sulfotelmatobacter sp.]